MDKRYQVFISSTYSDLKEERNKVMQAIMTMDCIPAGMELFPAIDEEQFNFIKKIIDDCDYYILIIGGRYGSLSENGVSYTEKEYDYAISKNIPVLAFLHKDIGKLARNKTETQRELVKKLEKFQKKVKDGKLVKFWETSDGLISAVLTSLMYTIKTHPQVGWVRSNLLTSIESLQEINFLQKKIQELEEYKKNIEQEKSKLNNEFADNLVGLDGAIEINGYATYSNWNQKEETKITWNIHITFEEIFALIAPRMMHQSVSEASIRACLLKGLYSKSINYDAKYTPHYNLQYLDIIKIQFTALGLIEVTSGETPKGAIVPYWNLTPKGYSTMMHVLSIKKTIEKTKATQHS